MGKARNQSIKTTKFYLSFFKVGPLSVILSWLIAGILALLPFSALLSTWAGSNFGLLDVWRVWKEILFLLMLPPAAWLVWRSSTLKKWLVNSWITRLFAVYIFLHLVLGTWAYANHEVNKTALVYSLIVNLRFIGFFILCFIVATYSDFLRRHWRKILLLPGGVVIVFGLMQKFLLPYDFLRHFGYGSSTIPAYQAVDANLDYRRIQSTLRGANPLGAYLILVIPALGVGAKKSKVLRVGVTLTGLLVLLFSYSRSAWLGLVAAVAALRAMTLKTFSIGYKTMLIVIALFILVGGGIYLTNKSEEAQNVLFHTSDDSPSLSSSNADRLASLEAGAKNIINQPLGRGPGTAGPASFRNDQPPRIAENYFLQIGQEVGVIGVLIFIAINTLLLKQLWARRNDQLAKILLASLIGLTFVNLVSHAWTDDTLAYLWWGLAGVALAPLQTLSVNSLPFTNKAESRQK